MQPIHVAGFAGEWTSRGQLTVGGRPLIVTAEGVTSDGTPTISWDSVGGAVSYEIYFSHDASRRIVHRQNGLSASAWESFPVADGHYTAWVRSFDSEGNASLWSKPHKIEVRAAVAAITADPTSPIVPGFDTTPTFEWSVAGPAAEYDLHIWNDQTRITQEGLRTRSWTPTTALTAGEWQWAVRGINSIGEAGPWRFASTNTTGQTRLLTPIGQTTDQTPAFNWLSVTEASRYELQVENLTTSALVINENQLTETTFVGTSSLPAGEYRAWVRAINSVNNAEGELSVPLSFTIVDSGNSQASNPFGSLLTVFEDSNAIERPKHNQQQHPVAVGEPRKQQTLIANSSEAPSNDSIDWVMSDLQALQDLLLIR